MLIQLLSFAAGLVAFIIYIVVFLVLMRFQLKVDWFTLQLIIGSLIHVISSVFFFYIMKGFLYWYALGIFSVCWFCFFTLSTAIYVSISANILRTINRQPEHALSLDEIFNLCIRKPFETRAEFLVVSKLAQKRETGYRISAAGKKNAQRVRAIRHFLGMEGSGLYSSVEVVKKGNKNDQNF